MKRPLVLGLSTLVAAGAWTLPAAAAQTLEGVVALDTELAAMDAAPTAEMLVRGHVFTRMDLDLQALHNFRPGYSFWQHIFTIPDGSVAFGSAGDGRLLAVFPNGGDWTRQARWEESSFADLLAGQRLPSGLSQRREQVAELLEPLSGPIVHNATRGNFLLPNARRYGGFLEEWGTIYERFGVPAEIGLAQAVVESGLNGRVRSEAGALGFCQWLPRNWDRLKRLAHHVIEGYNQTSQAPYCAAYLAILATKYGSYIPALSEHHAGGANVGRTVINGERLGGIDVRYQYLLGAEFARDLREMSPRTYTELVRTYGPRSFLYAEMVFGNTANVRYLTETTPQRQVFAMRAPRAIPIAEVTRRTGLSTDEVKRFNPALVNQVPRGANLYLPEYVADFGSDVSFWPRPADPAFAEVLNDFVRIEATPLEWDEPSFEGVLRGYQRRFEETRSEEGSVMAATIGYVIQELAGTRRILTDYRTNQSITSLFERGVVERRNYLVQRSGSGL